MWYCRLYHLCKWGIVSALKQFLVALQMLPMLYLMLRCLLTLAVFCQLEKSYPSSSVSINSIIFQFLWKTFMRNVVERFREIKYCHVYLISRVHWFRYMYIVCCHEQLGFTRSFSTEPMLVFMKNVLRVKMIHYLWNNYMFKHFGNNNCQWDWSVIFRFESASFFKK